MFYIYNVAYKNIRIMSYIYIYKKNKCIEPSIHTRLIYVRAAFLMTCLDQLTRRILTKQYFTTNQKIRFLQANGFDQSVSLIVSTDDNKKIIFQEIVIFC